MDLGEWWEKETGSPVPLGGIVMKRNFSDELKQKVNRIIRKSVEYAFANPKSSVNFVRENSREMSEEVMYKHIHLYVNKFSTDLGEQGRKTVTLMLEKAKQAGLISKVHEKIFCT